MQSLWLLYFMSGEKTVKDSVLVSCQQEQLLLQFTFIHKHIFSCFMYDSKKKHCRGTFLLRIVSGRTIRDGTGRRQCITMHGFSKQNFQVQIQGQQQRIWTQYNNQGFSSSLAAFCVSPSGLFQPSHSVKCSLQETHFPTLQILRDTCYSNSFSIPQDFP